MPIRGRCFRRGYEQLASAETDSESETGREPVASLVGRLRTKSRREPATLSPLV